MFKKDNYIYKEGEEGNFMYSIYVVISFWMGVW